MYFQSICMHTHIGVLLQCACFSLQSSSWDPLGVPVVGTSGVWRVYICDMSHAHPPVCVCTNTRAHTFTHVGVSCACICACMKACDQTTRERDSGREREWGGRGRHACVIFFLAACIVS